MANVHQNLMQNQLQQYVTPREAVYVARNTEAS